MPETRLDGVHHFTGVTADVTANIDFWCRILGLRFVKKTLNFETTFRYHPYYGDEQGNPGSVVTFLEFTEAPHEMPYGIDSGFRDPSGNSVRLTQVTMVPDDAG